MRKPGRHHQDDARISSDYRALPKRSAYDVVVIGSGYGGSITASRLARAGQRVCLLERGLELRPGEYPTNLSDALEHTQVRTDTDSTIVQGKPNALFDLRINEDVSALVGCGLGGTSLINANVSLALNEAVFERAGLEWPQPFRKTPDLLKPYYKLARAALGANPYPRSDSKSTPGYKALNKLSALEKSGRALGVDVKRPDINVNFNHGKPNYFGFVQSPCNLCGDCCSGCNVGAKNTTLMNYLPDARAHGAELFCNAEVSHIESDDGAWSVHIQPTNRNGSGRLRSKIVVADVVILAAGTLGSNEIMLRSKARGLQCSDRLGQHFSANGDLLAFGYNSYWKDNNEQTNPLLRENDAPRYEPIYGVGQGDNDLSEDQRPGPCITGVIDLRDSTRPLDSQLVIQEGVAPGALASVFLGGLVFGAARNANFTRYGPAQAESRLRDIESLASAVQHDPESVSQLAYSGPISRTQTYLVMSMDESDGRLKLNGDNVVIDWPNAGKSQTLNSHYTTLSKVNDAVQGQFIKNPISDDAFGNKLITVHPLGGCRMADNHHAGVVNHKGQVFDAIGASSVYQGLYICDGSIIPGALGVNPLLTISALAERNAALMADDHGWTIDYAVSSAKKNVSALKHYNGSADEPAQEFGLFEPEQTLFELTLEEESAEEQRWHRWLTAETKALLGPNGEHFKTSFQFSETMSGFVSQINNHRNEELLDQRDYHLAKAYGESQGNQLLLDMTINVADLRRLSQNRHTPCEITSGYVTLGRHHSKLDSGQLQLLIPDETKVDTWRMIYRVGFDDANGRPLLLQGIKTFKHTEESHWWTDLTHLNVDIFSAADHTKKRVYSGAAELNLQGLVKMASTFETQVGDNVLKELLGTRLQIVAKALNRQTSIKDSIGLYHLARLALSLAETVFRAYGGLLSTLNNFPKRDLLALKTRPHIAPNYECLVPTQDGRVIKLTRFVIAERLIKHCPPVILATGMGVKASSFATPTVDCNLVEYLCQRGRDVWLFDYRASEDSGSSKASFNIDDIAAYDWPAAIEHVRNKSGAKQVQIVAHCVGSMSLLMSLLKKSCDKKAIRSIVSSQLALHPVTNWLNNAKSDLDLVAQFKRMPLIQELGNVVDMDAGTTDFDRMFDVMANQLPVPHGEQCNNPACHRILAIYGPSYLHAQLNQATHLTLSEWFGAINLQPFEQMSLAIRAGHVVDARGDNSYFEGIQRADANSASNNVPQLDLPITFMAGALNQEFLPQSSARTYEWLRAHNSLSADHYRRHVFEDYGHMDCFIGKTANDDIFPYILQWLDERL